MDPPVVVGPPDPDVVLDPPGPDVVDPPDPDVVNPTDPDVVDPPEGAPVVVLWPEDDVVPVESGGCPPSFPVLH